MKGGVGKSTLSALLARYAYNVLDLDVLAIDLDPQSNLSQAIMGNRYTNFLTSKSPSVVEVFNGYQPPGKKRTGPSSLPLDEVSYTALSYEDQSLELIPSRFDFSDNLTGSVRPDPRVLARFLADNYQSKDVILIDCAPTESILTQTAYHASRYVLVPVKPEYFATIGFPLLQQSLTTFRDRNRGHQIDVAGVAINNAFYDGGNNGGPEKVEALKEIKRESKKNKWHIFKNEIPHSRGFPKMMRGNYSHLGNATQYTFFAREFFRKIGLTK